MNGRLLAKQGLANEQRFLMNEIERERRIATARNGNVDKPARPQWAITSYLAPAQNRRMARLRTLFSEFVLNTRMS